MRRTWDDDPNRGLYARAVIGNQWSLALRLPALHLDSAHHSDTFRVRVGEGKIETRYISELSQRRDIPIRPYEGEYGVVGVDGRSSSSRELRRLPAVSLRRRGTFFQVTGNGVSVATERIRWSLVYDFVLFGAFDATAVPSAYDIREYPTDPTLSAYRNWSCFRIRLPSEPTDADARWFSRVFQLDPQYPDIALSVIWPQSLEENAVGAHHFPPTRTILIAATRRAAGPAYLHTLVSDATSEMAYVSPIPATLNETTVFELAITAGAQTDVCYGPHERRDARDWWPIEFIEVAGSADPTPKGVTLGFGDRVSHGDNSFLFASVAAAQRLNDVRAGSAYVSSIDSPPGVEVVVRTRHGGSTTWEHETVCPDPQLFITAFAEVSRDQALDILISIPGFGSVYLGAQKALMNDVFVCAKHPLWLRHAVLIDRLSLSPPTLARRDVPRILAAVAAVQNDGRYAAIAMAQLSYIRKAKVSRPK